eukprot:6256633-Amphidinium_carterae.1
MSAGVLTRSLLPDELKTNGPAFSAHCVLTFSTSQNVGAGQRNQAEEKGVPLEALADCLQRLLAPKTTERVTAAQMRGTPRSKKQLAGEQSSTTVTLPADSE